MFYPPSPGALYQMYEARVEEALRARKLAVVADEVCVLGQGNALVRSARLPLNSVPRRGLLAELLHRVTGLQVYLVRLCQPVEDEGYIA